MSPAGRAGWVLAAALGLALAARRRGDWEVWKDHAHLRSNLSLDAALAELTRLGSGQPGDAQAVVRRGGRVIATIDHAAYVAAMEEARGG